MKKTINNSKGIVGLLLCLLLLSLAGNAQEQVAGTHFTVGLANVTSTSTTIEMDLQLTVDGSVNSRLLGFSAGINYNTAIVNGGTLTFEYIGGRSQVLSTFNPNTLNSTNTPGHLRIAASSLSSASGINVTIGQVLTLGRYRLTNSVAWPSASNAQLWLQNTASGRTATAISATGFGVTSGGVYAYSTSTPSGSPGVSLNQTSTSTLTLMLNAQVCATSASQTASSGVTCFGGSNGSSTITMSPMPTVASITYTVDGGTAQNATLVSGAFTVSNLTAGAHEIIISNTGCSNVTASSVSVGGPSQLTNSITETACDTYTWSVTGQTYTESGIYTGTTTNGSGCTVNETLNLTINTSSVYYADADGDGYGNASSSTNACSQPSGYVTNSTDCNDTNSSVNPAATEVANGIDDDCDGTIDEGTTPSTPGVTNQTVCKGSSSVILTATAFPGYTLRWYAAATGGTALPATPVVATSAVGPKSFWVSQRLGTTGPESLRAEITVTVVALPTEVLGNITSTTAGTTAGSYLAATTAVGQFVGTSTPVSYRIPPFTDTTLTYYWTVPTGVSIVSQTDNVLTVNFLNVSTAIGAVGSITVQAENGNGCRTAAKSVALTKALPTAPALTMNNGVNTTAITSFAKYMGTPTVLRLSAVAAATATNGYLWELPQGVNRMTALEGGSITTDLTSTDTFIFVNFAGVTLENTHTNATVTTTLTKVLRIGVKSVNAIGVSTTSNTSLTNPTTTSTASLLTLTAIAPAAPTALAMNNGANTTPITVISNLIGQGGTYRLSATVPATTIANRFTWELPACVTRVTDLGGLTSDNTSTSTNPEIFVRFNGSENPVAGSIYFGVKAVNDIGPSVTNNSAEVPATSSTAKLLKLVTAVPAAPTALALNNGANTTPITIISKLIGQGGTYRLSATVPATTIANRFTWELPACVTRVTDLGGLTSDNTSTSTNPEIFVRFNGSENPVAGSIYFGVKAVNDIGPSYTNNQASTVIPATSSTAKLLKLVTAVPVAPTALALNNGANATAITVISKLIGQGGTYRLSATVPTTTLANSFTWELPACVTRVTDLGGLTSDNTSTSTNPEIFVRFNGSENPVAGSIYFGVIAVNNVGPSVTNNSAAVPATSSTAKLLKLVTAVPAAPTALALNNGANATAITVISNLIGQGGTYRLSATVPATTLANSFTWELPACVTRVTDLGGLISDNTSTSTNPEIFVKFNGINPGPGSIYFGVKAVNNVGPSYTNNQALTVIPATSSTALLLKLVTAVPAVPGAITTTRANVCSIAGTNATAIYSVAPVALALANGYTWTVPQGALIEGTATGNSITVSYAGNFTAGNVSVTSSNGVGTSAATTLAVARTSGAVTPATIVGQVAGLCAGTAYNYSFAAGANAQTYTITGPVGSVVTSADNASNTSNVITTSNLAFTVVYPTSAIVNISIVATNPCGSSAAKTYVVSKAMGAITAISGPTAVDTCSEYTYTATAVVGAVAYTWTIPSGAQFVSGQGTNTLVVTFPGTLATGAVLKVLATNGCSVSSALKSSSVLTRTACPTAREEVVLQEVTKTPFSVKAYPNPYTETFNLSLSTSSEDKVSIVVYDMTGRLIERREVRPSDMVEQQIGDRQPSGVYNVVVTQGEEVKTLRVIKR